MQSRRCGFSGQALAVTIALLIALAALLLEDNHLITLQMVNDFGFY